MSIRRVRAMRLLLSFTPMVFVGCGTMSSYIQMEVYGNRMLLSKVIPEGKWPGAKVVWAFGDNKYAFKPAIYSPYPGYPTEWCLYVDLSEARPQAILLEHPEGDNAFFTYHIFDLKLDIRNRIVRGKGNARRGGFEIKGGNLVELPRQEEDALGRRQSRVEFVVEVPTNYKRVQEELPRISGKYRRIISVLLSKAKARSDDGVPRR